MPGLQATGAGSFLQSERLVRTKNKKRLSGFQGNRSF
jgi:hypothetical protein